jgi:PIN domain nuclease of toxin-antitoxin system
MRLLLDTHIFLWRVANAPNLLKKAHGIIDAADEVFVSSATIWELSIKVGLGKLEVDIDLLVSSIVDSGFVELPVRVMHAARVRSLPNIHHDPFDRILVAQAISEPLHLMTADAYLGGYSDLVLSI